MAAEEFKPEIFGKYILLEKIATGGMAEIYLAKSPGAENVSKFVAIKRILPQYSNNHEFIEMFKEEAKIAINLSHANVVSIIEFGIQNNLFFLAMQYVDGKNLRQFLNRLKKENKNLNLPQVVYLIKEAAKGLDHAHTCVDGTTGAPLNITHRDISPQNIMVSYDGEIRIIDFGIAKAESKIETTRAGTLKGKFGYMSPEQAEGYEVDFRTDIFSLGIVLWELLANDRLFVANSDVNALKKIRECHIPSLRKLDPNIPSELERITMKSLAKDRTLRYQSSEEFAQDLQLFLNKHYPEFNARDLSSLMKECFIEERDSTRQKLIEYSKIQLKSDDKTQVTDFTRTVTETGSQPNTNITHNSKINLKSDKNIGDFDLSFDKEEIIQSAVKRRKPSASGNVKNISPTFGTATGYPTYTHTAMTIRKKSFPWFKFLTALFITGSIYLYISHPEEFAKITDSILPQESNQSSVTPEKENSNELKAEPTEPFFNLFVSSIPSGATIYVDNVKANGFTPAQIRVPANKIYEIKLEKDGFGTQAKQLITTKQGEEFKTTLEKLEFGFINVSVTGANAFVYVNGIKISERTPIIRYKVQANINLRVQAFDPKTNTFAERNLKVSPNTVTQVHLNLANARQRVPSQRK